MRLIPKTFLIILLILISEYSPTLASNELRREPLQLPLCDTTPVKISTVDSLLCLDDSTFIHAPLGFSSYLWSTGQTSSSIKVSSSGIFSVTVIDAGGCIHGSNEIQIQQSGFPPKPQIGFDGPQGICYGSSAKLVTNAIGEYHWMNNSVYSFTTMSSPGIAWLDITNEFGCKTRSDTIVVDTLKRVVASLSYLNTTVCSNDSVYVAINTDGYPYSYNWSNGDMNSYSWIFPEDQQNAVVVTGENGCKKTLYPNIQSIYNWTLYNGYWDAQDIHEYYVCPGDTAYISFSKAPGNSYFWSDGDTTSVNKAMLGSVLGTHYILHSVCTIASPSYYTCIQQEEVVVYDLYPQNPPELIVQGDSVCPGSTFATLIVNGLNNLQWSTGQMQVSSINVSPNVDTYYTVTGYNLSNCTVTLGIWVHVKPYPSVIITGLDTTVCYGDTIQLVASGGSSYNWGSNISNITGPVFNNKIYYPWITLFVTGSNGCVLDTVLSFGLDQSANQPWLGSEYYVCSEDTVVLTPPSGFLEYNWSDGSTDSVRNVSPDTNTVYYCTYTSASGCTYTDYARVIVFNDSVPIVQPTIVYYPGDSVRLVGLSSAFNTFNWSNGATTSIITVFPVDTLETYYRYANNLNSGCVESTVFNLRMDTLPKPYLIYPDSICLGDTFLVSVSDIGIYQWMNGATTQSIQCSTNFYNNVIVSVYYRRFGLSLPLLIKDTIWITSVYPKNHVYGDTVTSTICKGETVELIAYNNPNFSYYWNTTDTTSTITVSPTQDSVFTVNVINDGCQSVWYYPVKVNLLPSSPIVFGDTIICAGYSTMLSAASNDSLVWSTGSHLDSIFVSPDVDQYYTVCAIDSNNCKSLAASIPVYVGSSAVSYIEGPSKICIGDSASLEAIGLNNYFWSTGDTSKIISISPTASTSYSVTGIDPSGCTQTRHFQVDTRPFPVSGYCLICNTGSYCDSGRVVVSFDYSGFDSLVWSTGSTGQSTYVNPLEPEWVVLNAYSECYSSPIVDSTLVKPRGYFNARIEGDTLVCPGAWVNLNLQLSVPGSFLWNNGATTQYTWVQPFSTTTYSVTITGLNGCTETLYYTVRVVSNFTDSIVGVKNLCGTDTIAKLECTEISGANYLWSNGGSDYHTDVVCLNPVNPVQVEITLNGGCSFVFKDTVERHLNTQNPQLTVPVQQCEGDSSLLILSGGIQYEWTSGAGGTSSLLWVKPDSTTLYAANVIYFLGDDAECATEVADTLFVVHPPVVNVSGVNQLNCAGTPVNLNANGAGTYSWNGIPGGSSINFILAADTAITVVGYGNCGFTDTVRINLPILNSSADTIFSDTLICYGENVSLNAPANGISYLWQDGTNGSVFSFKCETDTVFYCLVALDSNCIALFAVNVKVQLPADVLISGSFAVCNGEATQLKAEGALSYLWEGIMPGEFFGVFPTSDTLISVIGTDALGCRDTAEAEVVLLPTFDFSISGSSVICESSTVIYAELDHPYDFIYQLGWQDFTCSWSTGSNYFGTQVNDSNSVGVTATVTNQYGCTITKYKGFSVLGRESIIEQDHMVVCPGQTYTVRASANSQYLSYYWGNVLSTNNFLTRIANSDTTIILTVVTAAGCTLKDTVFIDVKPTVTLNITGPTTICRGSSCTWVANTTAANVDWYLPGQAYYTGDSITFTPTLSGLASIYTSDTAGCTVKVNKQISLINNSISLNDSIKLCLGDTTSVSVSGGNSWLWNTGDSTQSIIVSPISDTIYSVFVSQPSCSGKYYASIFVADTFEVAVYGDTATCFNQASQFNVTEGVSWLWSTGSISPFTILPAGSPDGPVFVQVEYYNGCYGTGSLFHYNYPSIPLVLTGDTIICGGSSTVLAAPQGYLSYLWSNGATMSSVSITPSQNEVYSISVTDGAGCVYVDSVTVGIASQPGFIQSSVAQYNCLQNTGLVRTFPINSQDSLQWEVSSSIGGPYVDLLNGVQVSGVNSDSLLISDVANMNGKYFRCMAYSDCFTGVSVSGAVQFTASGVSIIPITATICYNKVYEVGNYVHYLSGVYTDTLMSSLGCDSIIILNLSVDSTVINTNISFNGSQLSAVGGYSNYQWYDCITGNSYPGANSATFNAPSNSSVYVIISDGNCVDTSGCIYVGTTGVVDAIPSESFSVYPNPFNDKIEVVFSGSASGLINMELIDGLGQVVLSGNYKENKITIASTHLTDGLYVLKLRKGDLIMHYKLIKFK